MTEADGPSVAIIHNIVAPYRNPLFDALADEYDVTVYFCRYTNEDRKWNASLTDYGFDYELLDGFDIGPFAINPGLVRRLIETEHDCYLAAETLQTVPATFLTMLAARIADRPFVLWSGVFETDSSYDRLPAAIHESAASESTKDALLGAYARFGRWYRKALYSQADAFVAYSEQAKQYLLTNGVPERDVFVGGQIMPAEQIPNPSADREPRDGTITILSLGYLRPVKGIDTLIEAFGRIDAENAELLIAGSGTDEVRLRELADGDDRIEFLGYVDGAEKANCYETADVFVLPTFHDPWGLVVNEAMSFGLPIVTTNGAASADHLVDDNGIVVPIGSTGGLEEALGTLIGDEGLRKQMGARSEGLIAERNSIERAIKPFRQAIDHARNRYTTGSIR